MQTLKINKDGTFTLPKALREALRAFFKPSDKLLCFVEGDTLIIKRIKPPKLSELAERTKEKPMPLKELVKEVHTYRSEKKQK